MPRYLTLFRYTPQAIQRMVDSPNDRLAAVRETLEAVGGHVDTFAWMMGQYDGMLLSSAPD